MDGSYHTRAGGVDRAGNLGGPPARPGRKTPHISANRAFPSNQAVRVDGVYICVVKYVTQSTNASAERKSSTHSFTVKSSSRHKILLVSYSRRRRSPGEIWCRRATCCSSAPRRPGESQLVTSGLMVNVPTLTRVGVTGPRGCVRPVLMHMHAWEIAWAAPQTRTVGPRLLRVYSGSLAF